MTMASFSVATERFGKNVYNVVKRLVNGPNHMVVNVSGMPAGMYILQIKQSDKTEQYSFIKK